jgi:hypothetical protein
MSKETLSQQGNYPLKISAVVDVNAVAHESGNCYEITDGREGMTVKVCIASKNYGNEGVIEAFNEACRIILKCFRR